MLLKTLTLKDVGTYAGTQSFDLAPKTKYGAKRPIILFGGLNGAGKTTFLTAVRLALYGRQSLDQAPSQKQYEQYLLELIHRPKHFLIRPTQAGVNLEFEYARMGERVHYKVARFWEERSGGAQEKLVIYEGGASVPYLEDEQAQAFLNQLIPPGVAQFFFFDGEKIAALAKDDADVVLADAIKRLLGLDLLDRLSSDLRIYARGQVGANGDSKLRQELATLETQLAEAQTAYETERARTEALNAEWSEARERAETKKSELSSQGGAWSVNRGELEKELDDLVDERREREAAIKEALNGLSVFQLAPTLCAKVSAALRDQEKAVEGSALHAVLSAEKKALKELITTAVPTTAVERKRLEKVVDTWIDGFTGNVSVKKPKFEISVADARRISVALDSQRMAEAKHLLTEFKQAKKVSEKEERIQDKLAHAPSDDSIKAAFDEMTAAQRRVGELAAQKKVGFEEQRRLLWVSIDLVRKLRKCEERLREEGGTDRGQTLAHATRDLIAEFKVAAAVHKCERLKSFFVEAFTRLARKDDIVRDARIDPDTFKVTLLDESGREVAKKRLSAGEKQIYSIAMLEALAKTSGRNLPVIIDTPLGRLDSKHRAKLVESYFPVASHQVIILSTDTEVDGGFYEALSNKISHAFHLSYDAEAASTKVEPGYFWKRDTEIEKYAA